jgi:UDP-GlcNAc:undecaprenyl-phosphate GlcNAc-1-phosphate transferase
MWIPFIIAFAYSLALTPIARFVALRLGIVDRPDGRRKLQKSAVPLWGGVAVYVTLLAGMWAAAQGAAPETARQLRDLCLVLVPAAGFVCLLGCIDDSWDLNPRFKLLLQIVATLPIVLSGYTVDRVVAFGYPIDLGMWGIPLTVFWLVGCINALNLLDGLDGLASIVGLSTAVIMAIIASSSGHPHVAMIAVVLAGALAGFLLYNLPPASIYLGDSGSMVIGLVVGMLAIQGSLKTTATLSLTAPAVVLAIPIWDSLLAIVRRRLTGRSFDAADLGHIHHRLLDRGLTKWQVLCVIGAMCLLTGAAATASTLFSNEALAWVTVLTLVALMIRLRLFGHHELSLVKVALASFLTHVGHGLVASTRHGASVRDTGRSAHRFHDAWERLIQEAGSWSVRKLEFTVSLDGRTTARYLWSHFDDAEDESYAWSQAMSFDGPDGYSCRIQAFGNDDDAASLWFMLHTSKLISRFGRHWAPHLDQVPPVPLRLMVASREASAGMRSYRDAA